MAHEQTNHRALTHENLFQPENAGHLEAIKKAFPTFDIKAIQAGVAAGDEDAIECAQRMIGYHQQAREASALARIHATVVKEKGEDEGGAFVEVWAPLPATDLEFSGRLGKKVYTTGDEANDERSIRTALLSVIHTLREREVDPAAWVQAAEGGVQ